MSQHIREQVVRFGPRGILAGVLSHPAANRSRSEHGVLLLNAGLIHRAGPNRLYVMLARDLAALGLPTLRFDFAGLGDSGRRGENLALEQSVLHDIDDALTFAVEQTGAHSWLLIGHCSGAIISCYIAQHDSRVAGIVPINFSPALDRDWSAVDRDEKNARYLARYYANGVLKNPEKWRRFLTGRVNYRSIVGGLGWSMLRAGIATAITRRRSRVSAQAPRARPGIQSGEQRIDLDSIVNRGVRARFIFSEGNAGLDYLRAVSAGRLDALINAERIEMEIVPRSDHLFSTIESQRRLREIVRDFARSPERVGELQRAIS